MKKNNEDKKGKIIKGLMITGLATVLAIGGGAYIYNDIQVEKEAKLQAIAKAEEEKRLAEAKADAERELEKAKYLEQLQAETELIKLSNNTTDADAVLKDTENSTNPYGSDELEKQIKAEQKAKTDAEQKRIAEEKARAEEQARKKAEEDKARAEEQAKAEKQTQAITEQTTQTTEQATEQTTQHTTEPQTEATTQAPNNNGNNNTSDTAKHGDEKDGKTWIDGFGWVDGIADSSGDVTIPFGTHDKLSGVLIGE